MNDDIGARTVSVINPDEWKSLATRSLRHAWEADEHERNFRDAVVVLCLLDLARYGIRWGTPEPEWVRCVDASGCTSLTVGKVYRVDCRYPAGLTVVDDDNDCGWYMKQRFAPATAAEATVTIDVPVAWARYMAANEKCSPAEFLAAVDACREALSKAGLL